MKHSEVRELLPWYANSTLGNAERELVVAHLASCQECARELENLAMLQRAIVETGNRVEVPRSLTLDRALARIEEYEQTKAREANRRPALDSLRERIIEFWSNLWQTTPAWPLAMIAVQFILLVCLGGAFYYQQNKGNVVYTTSSAPSRDKSSTRIVVSFDDNASEHEIRQAISAVHGKIVDGPSALGLYTIQVPIPVEHTAEIQQALTTLRRDDRVVRFAEQKQ